MLHIQLLHLRRFRCLLCGLKRTDKKTECARVSLHRVCRRLETDGIVTRATFGVSQRLESAPRVSAVLQKLLHGLVGPLIYDEAARAAIIWEWAFSQ